jgi:hypothetical protein
VVQDSIAHRGIAMMMMSFSTAVAVAQIMPIGLDDV